MKPYCAVLLSYNHPNLTRMTLNSLLAAFNEKDIILVHNGSTKDNVSDLTQAYPNITHLVLEENKGYSGGANQALLEGFRHSPWVYFFTNDTECMTLPQTMPAPGFYAPVILRSDKKRVDSMGGFFNLKQNRLYHAKTSEEFSLAKKQFLQDKSVAAYIPGTAFLIHHSVFEKTGAFDESLHTYWEDVDFSIRVQLKGFELNLLENFILSHKGGRTCKKDPFYTNFLFKRNQATISKKYNDLFHS